VIDFLSDPRNHQNAETIQRIDTHAAIIFLAGPLAYKIKREVAYPFLDFSTLEKRQQACEHEIEVNQANAPQIYIGTIPLTCQPENHLKINGSGKVVEWAVLMNRFDENHTLDKIIATGPLPDNLANSLAREMARAHAAAPVKKTTDWVANLRQYINHNTQSFNDHADAFPPSQATDLTTVSIKNYTQIKPLLEKRLAGGHVRLCHGDAHLGNIVLLDDQPVYFDAIEFNDAIAIIDVLYDLAFLLMDLWHRGHKREANLILNRYLSETQNINHEKTSHYSGLTALPFFMMMRAMIRARVTVSKRKFCPPHQHADLTDQARAYFSTACDFFKATPPRLIAIGGLSGSGKTTVAINIAANIGRSPGAVILRSDVIRKKLFGVCETEHLPQSAYSSATTQAVYKQLYETAAQVLTTGHSVIVDAVFARKHERDEISQIARSSAVPFSGIWLNASEKTLVTRVSTRTNDASDADETVVKKQLAYKPGPISWTKIDATGKPEDVSKRVITTLKKSDSYLQ